MRIILGKNKHKSDNSLDFNKLKYYYGIPHCHSSYSTGKGNPLEVFNYAIKCNLDFLFLTDHNNFLTNTTLLKDTTISKWNASNIIANKIYKNTSNFLPIVGFECKTINFGDLNIINPNTFFTGAISDLRVLALWMINNENAFISINHPHKNISNLPFSEVLNKIITSVEVCNGNPAAKYTHHEKYYYYLLDQGWKLGAINGQDNHKLNFNDSDYLTVYIGTELSKTALIEAFRNHRTYSTESRFLKFYFLINDTFMGETLYITKEKLKFNIFIEDIKYKILEVQIISNAGTIIRSIDNLNINNLRYLYEHIYNPKESWYIIKIIQEGNKVAFSSPIFIVYDDSYIIEED